MHYMWNVEINFNVLNTLHIGVNFYIQAVKPASYAEHRKLFPCIWYNVEFDEYKH